MKFQQHKNTISDLSVIGLKVQGYISCSSKHLAQYRMGIRFAYGACAVIILLGQIFQNIYFSYAAAAIALGGMFPPRHPLDYVYNGVIRYWFKKPAIPPRPP